MQDVIVIGGSFAGLTAALQLARTGRSVTVIDAGKPRNRMSPTAHGVPGWDGATPTRIIDRFREDLDPYASATVLNDMVTGVTGAAGAFTVALASGSSLGARRIVLAHGVADILPDLPGLAEAWGKTALHCPYCHGHEVRDRPLAVLANHPMSGHQAALLHSDWSTDVTVLTGIASTFAGQDHLPKGVTCNDRPVAGVTSTDAGITVTFKDGSTRSFGAMFVAPAVSIADTPAAMLGCAAVDGPLGAFIQVGPMAQTSIRGVFAAGDCARPAHNVTSAIGDGGTAGTGCHTSLVFPDFIQPVEAAAWPIPVFLSPFFPAFWGPENHPAQPRLEQPRRPSRGRDRE